MNEMEHVWIVRYDQILGDILYVCKTEACAHAQAEAIVKGNRERFDEYQGDKPRNDELPYSRMNDGELLEWWFEYTETNEDIQIEKLEVLSDTVACH